VRILDRNYARAAALQRFRAHGGTAADFIVRVPWRAFRLRAPDGSAFSLIAHLQQLPDDTAAHEVMVEAATAPGQPPLPLRLIILRLAPEVAEATRVRVRRAAPRKQKKLDPRTLVAAGFIMPAPEPPPDFSRFATKLLAR
jgi:hypothetical protein